MKLRFPLVLAAAALAAPALAQFEAPQPSPKATLTQRVGLTDVTISYSRPSVKGRAIWGALVPLDKPWRTGANAATTITFSDDVTVEGQKLAAGTYSIVTIPGKDEWTVIFNNDTKLWWETEYDAAKDALRVKAKPQAVGMVETLHIGFPSIGATSAVLAIEWEKVSVPVTIGVDVDAKLKKALAAVEASAWQAPLDGRPLLLRAGGEPPRGLEAPRQVDRGEPELGERLPQGPRSTPTRGRSPRPSRPARRPSPSPRPTPPSRTSPLSRRRSASGRRRRSKSPRHERGTNAGRKARVLVPTGAP